MTDPEILFATFGAYAVLAASIGGVLWWIAEHSPASSRQDEDDAQMEAIERSRK